MIRRPSRSALLAFVVGALASVPMPAAAATASLPGAGRDASSESHQVWAASAPVETAAATTAHFAAIARGLNQPDLVTNAGDSSGRLFIVEKVGRIRIWKPSAGLLRTPFLDIHRYVSGGSEQGLLGLAFPPDFRRTGYYYVNYTNKAGDTVINRYRVSSNRDRSGTSPTRILTIDQPYPNHNGGQLAFGPDGFLYIGMGDGGGAGDPGNRAQSVNSLLGKILRIDVSRASGGRNYSIPSNNPYVGTTGLDEIYAIGLRNPWRFSFDRSTHDLWIGDVGQNRYEEVDRALASSGAGRGANFGWRQLEGRHCFNPSTGCSTSGKVMPLVEYSHSAGRCSVTGGYVYRGTRYPSMRGRYIYGDFCSGEVFSTAASAASPAGRATHANTSYLISSFGEAQNGELYLTNLNGYVYHLTWG